MTLRRHALTSLAIVLASLAVAWPLLSPAGAPTLAAVGFGAGLNLVNAVTAHALFVWAQGRPTRAFMGAILGGMVGRMAFMLGAVVLGIVVLDLPSIPLAASVLSYFVVFLVIELTAAHKTPGVRLEEAR